MTAERLDCASRPSDVSQQKLDDRRGTDHLRPRRMLCPAERIGDRACPLTSRVPAQQLGYLHQFFGTATADPSDGFGSVPGVMPLQDLEDAERVLESGIDAHRTARAVGPR